MTVKTETPRIREAYVEYLKLGLRRSIPLLRERLEEVWGGVNVPTEATLSSWSTSFSWRARVAADDEIINRRALDRIRDRLSSDIEVRRARRVQLADVQLNAALRAMVVREVDPITGQETQAPRDLLTMDPSALRAINDTIRLASETQRLDLGEAVQRIEGQESPQERTVRVIDAEEMTEEFMRFVGVANDDGIITVMPSGAVLTDSEMTEAEE